MHHGGGGKTRHMYLDKLCQMWEYCYQICASTSYTLRHTRRYIIHHPHLWFTCFHSHTSPHPPVWCVGYYLTNFCCTYSPALKFGLQLGIVMPRQVAPCAFAGDDMFLIHFYPIWVFWGGHPRTRYSMTNFWCVMSSVLQFEMELGIDVYDLLAKDKIRHMNGSWFTCTVIGCTTVEDYAWHTLGPTFVAHNLLMCTSQWSFPWMFNAMVQKHRYGTWLCQKIHTPPYVHHGRGWKSSHVIRQTLSNVGILLPNLRKHVMHIGVRMQVSHLLSAFVFYVFS